MKSFVYGVLGVLLMSQGSGTEFHLEVTEGVLQSPPLPVFKIDLDLPPK